MTEWNHTTNFGEHFTLHLIVFVLCSISMGGFPLRETFEVNEINALLHHWIRWIQDYSFIWMGQWIVEIANINVNVFDLCTGARFTLIVSHNEIKVKFYSFEFCLFRVDTLYFLRIFFLFCLVTEIESTTVCYSDQKVDNTRNCHYVWVQMERIETKISTKI